MVILELNERTRFCLDGGIIQIPADNTRVFNRDGSPTEDFKDWMRVNVGHFSRTTAAYTTHSMGWVLLPFMASLRGHIPVLVRYPEKLMLIKLTWF